MKITEAIENLKHGAISENDKKINERIIAFLNKYDFSSFNVGSRKINTMEEYVSSLDNYLVWQKKFMMKSQKRIESMISANDMSLNILPEVSDMFEKYGVLKGVTKDLREFFAYDGCKRMHLETKLRQIIDFALTSSMFIVKQAEECINNLEFCQYANFITKQKEELIEATDKFEKDSIHKNKTQLVSLAHRTKISIPRYRKICEVQELYKPYRRQEDMQEFSEKVDDLSQQLKLTAEIIENYEVEQNKQ